MPQIQETAERQSLGTSDGCRHMNPGSWWFGANLALSPFTGSGYLLVESLVLVSGTQVLRVGFVGMNQAGGGGCRIVLDSMRSHHNLKVWL